MDVCDRILCVTGVCVRTLIGVRVCRLRRFSSVLCSIHQGMALAGNVVEVMDSSSIKVTPRFGIYRKAKTKQKKRDIQIVAIFKSQSIDLDAPK
jgi:hypothetical protein